MKTVEQSGDSHPVGLFIRSVPIAKFFGEQSKRKFHVQTNEAILLVDAGENEYETDVYFWVTDHYQHETVDY